MLHDTQPDEPKTLIEEKLKKVTTERAPVVGAQTGRGGAQTSATQLLQSMEAARSRAGLGSELNEILRLSAQAAREIPQGRSSSTAGGDGSGAAAAAGVLTAVDEDNEGDEEAPKPADFEYFTDAEDEE